MYYIYFIEKSLKAASEIANSSFGKVSGSTKPEDNNQVLTEVDLAVGKLLIDRVQKEYPSHNIIDEEAGIIDKKSEFTWVIDPIDGTSNFVQGVPTYGIMIGLLKDDKPYAGGIALPYFSEIYTAFKGKRAFCNRKKIKVSDEKNLLNTLVAYGIDSHQENPELTRKECEILADIILHIRNLRTSNSAFDMAMVAKGKYAAYLNKKHRLWDNVALQIIIEEAGGLFTDFYGKPVNYHKPLTRVTDNFTICAAPPQIHKQLQDIIRKYT